VPRKKLLRSRLKSLSQGKALRERLVWPLLAFVAFYLFGILGYYFIGLMTESPLASLRHSIYQSAIVLTSVGLQDILNSNDTWVGSIFTVILSFLGLSVMVYALSTITAFIVGGELRDFLEARRMEKRIEDMQDHFLICGGGETGQYVAEEMLATDQPFVLIEIDPDRATKLREIGDFCYLVADASDDTVLQDAGIERARGLISALSADKDNLLTVITARQMNPGLRIVSRCVQMENERKLRKAGANAVVSPNMIGGRRMANVLTRPGVVTFMDELMRDNSAIRFENVRIAPGHALENKTLAEANFHAIADVNIIATREPGQTNYQYNPRGNLILTAGITLIAIGLPAEITKLREYLS